MKKLFTGIKDLDMKILNELDDKDLVQVSVCSKYIHELCNTEIFWKNRLVLKYSDSKNEILKYSENRNILKYGESVKKIIKPDDRSYKNHYIQISINLRNFSFWNFLATLRLGNKGIENSSYYDGYHQVKVIPERALINYYLKNLGNKVKIKLRSTPFTHRKYQLEFSMQNCTLEKIHEKILPFIQESELLALVDHKKRDDSTILIFCILKK